MAVIYSQKCTNEKVHVRMGCEADTPFLQEWLSDPGTSWCMPCGEPNEIEECAKLWVGLCHQQAVLTAEVEGRPCGMCILFLATYVQLRHQCMHILVVDPKCRRQGIGSLLLEEATRWAREGCGVELLHAELIEGSDAVPFYLHRGYEIFAKQAGWAKEGEHYLGRVLVERMVPNYDESLCT
jgi:GNAT superfamily N-acetyltransferase